MSMTKGQIEFAVEDRLVRRWKERCLQENASPICTVAIKGATNDQG